MQPTWDILKNLPSNLISNYLNFIYTFVFTCYISLKTNNININKMLNKKIIGCRITQHNWKRSYVTDSLSVNGIKYISNY